ncbi:DUF3630 family protein [Aliivibrio fischeri]|uniref:DUF3630 family protein n=1 Tax=Aliivibrio fischeri TaxID=668 RepID=UPI0012D9E60A|nr:DUF3630 family protein [Aliivibrio fischeri]MUK29379.1 DUF3630 family protein [Aliivibrio fischeri]MUK65421.1 DUF3630 family protein [Aliivibrio fischeri]
MSLFSVIEFDKEVGRIIFTIPDFDFDTFNDVGKQLVSAIDAKVIEQQVDADLHSWLIDFEGTHLMLRAEHYSNSVWLESLSSEEALDELSFIVGLF